MRRSGVRVTQAAPTLTAQYVRRNGNPAAGRGRALRYPLQGSTRNGRARSCVSPGVPGFEFRVTDDRFEEATLYLVDCENTRRAEELARGLLAQSPHHQSVEARCEGRLLFTMSAAARAPMT